MRTAVAFVFVRGVELLSCLGCMEWLVPLAFLPVTWFLKDNLLRRGHV